MNALGSPLKANQGLHMAVEHPIITRDMPDPAVIVASKKLDYELQAWNGTDSQMSMLVPKSSSKLERGRRDSEEIVSYSKNETVIQQLKSSEKKSK